MICVALTGLALTVWLDRLDRAARDELDDKMLECVGSDQLTGIRSTRWSDDDEVSADECGEADRACNAAREQQRIWYSTKLLRRKVRWHEREIRSSCAEGKRYATELIMLSGCVDIRAVTEARTPESKAIDGGAYATGPLEAVQAVTVLRGARSEECPERACKARLDATVTSPDSRRRTRMALLRARCASPRVQLCSTARHFSLSKRETMLYVTQEVQQEEN